MLINIQVDASEEFADPDDESGVTEKAFERIYRPMSIILPV